MDWMYCMSIVVACKDWGNLEYLQDDLILGIVHMGLKCSGDIIGLGCRHWMHTLGFYDDPVIISNR